ncbi:MAG TPA: V-type ATP synthase subunit D [Phaeodactylibacter sp.]|nr:V-type ATP synthase subunit D [Phaeodactylibacter sp.]
MAISFQYNKTSLQRLKKQLKIRENALPILKNKEAALRVEVKNARKEAEGVAQKLEETIESHRGMAGLWEEFDFDLLEVEDVKVGYQKVAGVSTPVLEDIEFIRHPFSLFNRPAWFPAGMELLKEWIELALQHKILLQKMELLEFARKKTTQKVNLYEKVQIPGYEDAIRKIERYLEDEENLAKAAQKIVKKRTNSESL